MSDSPPTKSEAERLREAWLALSSKIMAIVKNHMLGLASMGQPLTDEDLALGNTREMQDGFENCMHMVTMDYIDRLVIAHNEMTEVFGSGGNVGLPKGPDPKLTDYEVSQGAL